MALRVKAADLQAIQFSERSLIFLERLTDLVRDFLLVGSVTQFCRQPTDRVLDGSSLAPQVPGTPIQVAQAVHDRPANAELRIGAELRILHRIELLGGIDQPQDPGADQIFEIDLLRQLFVNPTRDEPDHRQIFKQRLVWIRHRD